VAAIQHSWPAGSAAGAAPHPINTEQAMPRRARARSLEKIHDDRDGGLWLLFHQPMT
jgi:hypothetical protein